MSLRWLVALRGRYPAEGIAWGADICGPLNPGKPGRVRGWKARQASEGYRARGRAARSVSSSIQSESLFEYCAAGTVQHVQVVGRPDIRGVVRVDAVAPGGLGGLDVRAGYPPLPQAPRVRISARATRTRRKRSAGAYRPGTRCTTGGWSWCGSPGVSSLSAAPGVPPRPPPRSCLANLRAGGHRSGRRFFETRRKPPWLGGTAYLRRDAGAPTHNGAVFGWGLTEAWSVPRELSRAPPGGGTNSQAAAGPPTLDCSPRSRPRRGLRPRSQGRAG
jgi:hypothetical protein